MAQRLPAAFRQMRHHRGRQQHNGLQRLAPGGGIGLGRGADGIGQGVKLGDGAVETQMLQMFGHGLDGLVHRLAQGPGLRIIGADGGARHRQVNGFRAQPVNALDEPPAAFRPGIGPFNVAFRRGVRQHEPADGVGAVIGDDGLRRDHILFRLGHFLGRADRDLRIGAEVKCFAVALFNFVRRHPAAIRVLVGLVTDHALREEAGERFGIAHQTQFGHGAGEITRIEKMQDGVLDAADILVHRHPVVGACLVHRRIGMRIGEAQEVPGGIRERVQRIGVPNCRALARWASRGLPGDIGIKRIALDVEVDDLGQLDGQLVHGHRHHATLGAMDHGNGTAPGALARYQPVAQAVIHRALADAVFLKPRGDFGLGLFHRHAVQEARIGQLSRADIGFFANVKRLGIGIRRHHHRRHAQLVFAGEIQVALVMRRAAENRAGAVAHQHKVGHHNRQLPVRIEGMRRRQPGVVALLLGLFDIGFRGADVAALFDEGGELRVRLRQFLRQGVFR